MISEPGGRRAATSAVSAASTATATGKGFKGYWNKVEGSSTAKFAHNTDIRCNWVNQHETILFISSSSFITFKVVPRFLFLDGCDYEHELRL